MFHVPLLRNSALRSGPFREGTCAPRRVGGQVRYLNDYDCRILRVSSRYLPVDDALVCFATTNVLDRQLLKRNRVKFSSSGWQSLPVNSRTSTALRDQCA